MDSLHRCGKRPNFLSTLYDACIAFQAANNELVVFSPMAGEFVMIAWCVPNVHASFNRLLLMMNL